MLEVVNSLHRTQAGLTDVTKNQVRKIVICPHHRRNLTRLLHLCLPCQHPLHKGENTEFKKPKKVTADMSDSIFQETGSAVPIASRKYSVCYNDCIHVHLTYIHFALSMKKK